MASYFFLYKFLEIFANIPLSYTLTIFFHQIFNSLHHSWLNSNSSNFKDYALRTEEQRLFAWISMNLLVLVTVCTYAWYVATCPALLVIFVQVTFRGKGICEWAQNYVFLNKTIWIMSLFYFFYILFLMTMKFNWSGLGEKNHIYIKIQ